MIIIIIMETISSLFGLGRRDSFPDIPWWKSPIDFAQILRCVVMDVVRN